MTAPLELIDVTKSYRAPSGARLPILKGASLSLKPGERAAVVGASGSGKSTLLHVAGLLDKIDNGRVILTGNNAGAAREGLKAELRNRHLGFVYQAHHLLPDFTALENVMMPALIGGKSGKKVAAHALELLSEVSLAARKNHLPGQLSGGEQQRVAIARALMNGPEVLLADEPTGNLDPATANTVFELFHTLAQGRNMSLLMVTHNLELAHRCDSVYKLEDGRLTRL